MLRGPVHPPDPDRLTAGVAGPTKARATRLKAQAGPRGTMGPAELMLHQQAERQGVDG